MARAGTTFTTGTYEQMLSVPHAEDGMAIGLYGGSFNPPHRAHVHVAKTALKRLGLHQLWWMVSPGNPLKDVQTLPSLKERLGLSRNIISDPRVKITGFEATLETKYSADLVAKLTTRYPKVRFIWVMGADNLTHFHRWERWQEIANTVPICVIDRPGDTLSTRSSRAARNLLSARLDESDAHILKYKTAPAWTFLHAPRLAVSSTEIRNRAR